MFYLVLPRIGRLLCWFLLPSIMLSVALMLHAGPPPATDLPAAGLPPVDSTKAAQPKAALVFAFQTNLGYCRQWLATNDFKSLGQSVTALSVLTDALGRNVAESGQEKITSLHHAVDELVAAAKAADAGRAQQAIDALPKAIEAVETAPGLDHPRPATKTVASFTPLMHLIDGTFTDAKAALATGDVTAAKTYAVVLVELAQWLAADRAGAVWQSQAGDLAAAAQDVASSTAIDPKLLRTQFHDVYACCAACHQRQR
ncbi:MAG TPA: hypothetical protein VMJ32_11775 [Pirellulales bacterium]|nr:hypothetical protein [Pirellulales bacterium]